MVRAGYCPVGRRFVKRAVTRRLFLLAAVAAAVLHAEDFAGQVVAITRMRHNGASERIRLWWNDGPEMKQPFGTHEAAYRRSGFRTDGHGECPLHRTVQTHRRRDHPAGWAQPEPGTCSRWAGMLVSTVRVPGDGAAGPGAGGAGCDAWAVERPEAGGALGVAEGGRRRATVMELARSVTKRRSDGSSHSIRGEFWR